MRVSSPRKTSSASSRRAMARFMSLSLLPSAATTPPSSPPFPASMTQTVFPVGADTLVSTASGGRSMLTVAAVSTSSSANMA